MNNTLIKDGRLDRAAAATELRQFLASVIGAGGFRLSVNVHVLPAETIAGEGEPEVFADLEGTDQQILLERGAEVLKALEQLAFQALRLHPQWHEKIQLDCAGYRAMRFEELRMTARLAAERVLFSRQSFQLNPMSSRERRVVHLALKAVAGVRTESVGTGEKRQVVIHPAEAKSTARG